MSNPDFYLVNKIDLQEYKRCYAAYLKRNCSGDQYFRLDNLIYSCGYSIHADFDKLNYPKYTAIIGTASPENFGNRQPGFMEVVSFEEKLDYPHAYEQAFRRILDWIEDDMLCRVSSL